MTAAHHNLLPEGRHQARLEARYSLPSQGPNAPKNAGLELVVVNTDGPCVGRRHSFRVWGQAKVERARKLRQGEPVMIVVVHKRLDSGGIVARVVDVYSANKPSAVEAMGNQTTTTKSPRDGSGSPPSEEVPDGLIDRLRSAIQRGSEPASWQDNAVASMSPPPSSAEEFPTGFHWKGAKNGRRTLVDFEAVLQQHANCGPTIVTEAAGFISMFEYGADIADYMEANGGSLSGFRGRCWSRWVAIDIDCDGTDAGLDQVLAAASTIVGTLKALGVPASTISVFFSGRRGIHILWPSGVFAAEAKDNYETTVGVVCRAIAGLVGVEIDPAVYKPLAALRAPNTRHEGSGLYKVIIPLGLLGTLDASSVRELAKQPSPFEMPDWRVGPVPLLHELWRWACGVEAGQRRRTAAVVEGDPRIFADTIDLIAHGAPEGTRGMRFFRAAANLLDYDCEEPLLRALLEPAARLCGYPPEDFDSQINGALNAHARRPTVPS